MEIEILKVSSVAWQTPVTVEFVYGGRRVIRGPQLALHCLLHEWPQHEGHAFEFARQKCLSALERGCAADDCKEAFIAAALEAGVRVVPADSMPWKGHQQSRLVEQRRA